LLALALVLACAKAPTPPSPAASSVQEGHVTGAGGTGLHYVVEGAGPDTIVVLHGGPGLDLEGLRLDLAPLAANHTVLYFDQRGSGRSEMPDTLQLTVQAMVEDLEALRQAFHLERMTLFGHSWGGGLTLLYAMRHPTRVARMVLVGSLPLRGRPYAEQYFAAQAARRDSADNRRLAVLDSLVAFAEDPLPLCRESTRLYLRGVTATPAAAERIHGDLCAADARNLRWHEIVGRRVFQSFIPHLELNDWDWRAEAAELAIPALVVHGADDPLPLAGAREMAATLPQAVLVVIPDAGHYPHAEQPDTFFRAVERFLHAALPPSAPAR
jgi:proline iminopeptidase